MQNKSINGFTLQCLLGTGGMAEVWYAESKIGTKAAVKILNEKLSHDDQMQERFLNEAKVMVQLDHPNIRKVYGFDEIDGRPAIVMEYLDGSDLKARMKQGQRFTQEELVKWWDQMVDALNYTHQKGIVHRDIKPSNIFVDAEGNAKLLDFGIAKVRDSISSTQTGQKLGTLMYMSPEQVRDPKRVGAASDAYSLAVTFVHLLTGKAPYDSTTDSDYDIQESIVRKPLDLSGVPDDWCCFIAHYLAKNAEDRPALRPFKAVASEAPEKTDESDDEGTIVGDVPKNPVHSSHQRVTPSAASRHSGLDPQSPAPKDDPHSKKGLWISLGIAAVAVVVTIMAVLLWPKDPYKEIDHWLKESECIYDTCLEATVVDYSNDIAQLNIGYDYCSKASQALSGMENKDAEEWTPRMNRCDSLNFGYVKKVSAYVEKELDDLQPDQNTAAIIGRLKQLEEFYYIKMNVDNNGMLERMEKEIELGKKELVFTVSGVSFVMKRVAGGTFQMGSNDSGAEDDEKPVHSVTVSTFYMGETEVTQALWKAVMGSEPTYNGGWENQYGRGDNYPAYRVSWNECQEFIRKLNSLTGRNFRLPTEAEWEYAARGGNQSNGYKYAGSNSIGSVAWYNDNSGSKTHAVKGKSPNELGLYDMSGNVWEWCGDWYGSYGSGSQTNPKGPSSGSDRVLRGGSWYLIARHCRVSNRRNIGPCSRSNYIGFRLCLPQ